VEASSEIQQAARRVADENRRLRGLLNKQGVSDEMIEGYLQSGASQSTDSQYRSPATGQAVYQLENMLAPRRPACLDPSAPFPPLSAGVRPREASVASIPSHQPSWDAPSRTMPPSLPRMSPPHQQNYVTTPTTTTAGMPRSEPAYAAHHHGGLNSILEDPRHHASRSPMSPHGHGDGGHASSHGLPYEVSSSIAQAPHQGYGHHLPPAPVGHHHSHTYASSNSSACCPPVRRRDSHAGTLHSNGPGPDASHGGYLPPASATAVTLSPSAASDSANTTANCRHAAEIISSVTGHDPSSVRAALGCGDSMDCHVDEPTFRRALDRYGAVPTTGPTTGPSMSM